MSQVSLYLDQEVLETARRNARIENISLSKYVSRALMKQAEAGWPQNYWELFGALADDTFVCPEDVPFNQISETVRFS